MYPKISIAKRRYQEDLLYEITVKCKKEPVLKTQVMYGCNLSFTELNEYLSKAVKGNYLAVGQLDKKHEGYKATTKGLCFVNIYGFLNHLLNIGINQETKENKDPYVDTKLSNQIQAALNSLNIVNKSLETLKIPITNIFDFKHRSRYFIIEDVLDLAIEGTRKTYMMYRCNLSFTQLKRYLKELEKTNMIKPMVDSKELKTTDKGKIFIMVHQLERYLLETGGDSDPFKDENSIWFAQIEAALSPVLSIEVPKEAHIISPQPI